MRVYDVAMSILHFNVTGIEARLCAGSIATNFVMGCYPRLWQYEVRVTIRAPTPDDIPNTVRVVLNPRAFSQRASVQYSTRTVLYLLISHFVLVRVLYLYISRSPYSYGTRLVRPRVVQYSYGTVGSGPAKLAGGDLEARGHLPAKVRSGT